MRKLIAIVCALLCLAGILVGCSSEAVEFAKTEDGYALKKFSDNSTLKEFIIPDEYEEMPVTQLLDFSCANLKYVEKVVIGKNVKEISTWAFTSNKEVKEYVVAEGNEYFTSVDGVLFTKDMKELVKYPIGKNKPNPMPKDPKEYKGMPYTIPDGVEIIRDNAFYKASMISVITFPASLKEIGERAFLKSERINTVNFSEGLEVIKADAFFKNELLANITIPASVVEIGSFAFRYCSAKEIYMKRSSAEGMNLAKTWMPLTAGNFGKPVNIVWGA